MFVISKQFAFSASHQLSSLPEGHKCKRLHGHNYVVTLKVAADELNGHGFVMDYGDLAPFGAWVAEHFDHRHLNDCMGETPTTAEQIARHLYGVACSFGWNVVSVAVSETPKTEALYELSR